MKLSAILTVTLICNLQCSRSFPQSTPIQTDILIRNGMVFDGSLQDAVQTDIGITGDRISFIGDASRLQVRAKREIDAKGLMVTPGFIDPHTHTEKALSDKSRNSRANLPYLTQGVTTILTGNDGYGTVQTGKQLQQWEEAGIGTNAALFVGFGSVRGAILGTDNVKASDAAILKMKALVEQAMKEGAMGLSTGLSYIPQNFSNTAEVTALAAVAAKYNGVYDTHMRNQGTGSTEAIDEVLEIGRGAGIALHISHIKASMPAAWGMSRSIVQQIEAARSIGVNITASQYPYLASGDALKILIPTWAKQNGNNALLKYLEDPVQLRRIEQYITTRLTAMGGPSSIMISTTEDKSLIGKTIQEISKGWSLTPEETVVRILQSYPGTGVSSFVMSEDDLRYFMKQSWVVTGSDGVPGHPRAAGSFTKKIRQYALDSNLISLPFAIHNSTGHTATIFAIKERGFIREGYFADIVIFDPHTIKDEASYTQPGKLSEGVLYVIVNGAIAIDKGKYTGALAGKALRHYNHTKP